MIYRELTVKGLLDAAYETIGASAGTLLLITYVPAITTRIPRMAVGGP